MNARTATLIALSLLAAAASPAMAAGPKPKNPGHGPVTVAAHGRGTGGTGKTPSPNFQVQGPSCNLFVGPTIVVVPSNTPPGFPFSNGQIVFADHSVCDQAVPILEDEVQLVGPTNPATGQPESNITAVSVVGQGAISVTQSSTFLPSGLYTIFESVTVGLPAGFTWNEPVPANCVTTEDDTVITCEDIFTGIDV